MASRSLGAVDVPKFCAEHTHEIPSFERAKETISSLEDYETFFEYAKPNLARGGKLLMSSLLVAGVAFPMAIMAAPALGGAIGTLASGGMLGGGLTGAAATNYGLALLGGGSLAAGGLGMAGGTMVITSLGTSLGAALGASITNSYVRDDKSFKIERFRDGPGTPIVIARGFTTEKSEDWAKVVIDVEKRFPDSSIYFLYWGSKELADVAVFFGNVGVNSAAHLGAIGAARRATKAAASKIGPLMPASIAANLAKNPWHVALNRADKTGVALAGLVVRVENSEFILVGHSLGGRVMSTAAQTLATTSDGPRIRSIYLFGAAIGQRFDWKSVADSVVDFVHNFHSKSDIVLKYLYSTAQFGDKPVGFHGINLNHPKIKNYDLSDVVKSHSGYYGSTVWE